MAKQLINVPDGFISLERGMDSGKSASLLARNQYALGTNFSCRGGFISTRFGFKKSALTFSGETTEGNFESGLFQGAFVYQPDFGNPFIVASIAGRLFSINLTSLVVTEISIPGDLNPSNRPMAWMTQAENYLIIQDGQSKPIIFDGSGCVRSNTSNRQVPVGQAMAYGMGRLWVSRGRSYVAGDIVGGPSGTAGKQFRDAVLWFTENDYINEGGAFSVPLQSGDITAMQFTSNLNTSLGQGELAVFTQKAVFSTLVPVDRTTWKDLTNPIQRVAQINFGALGQNGVVVSNGDLFYRSIDGIRSLVMAIRQFDAGWGNVPVSNEMNRVLLRDDKNLLSYASAVIFDNRLFMTASPFHVGQHGVPHKGFVSLDFNLISSMSEKFPPAYEGLWCGIAVLQFSKAVFGTQERLFALALNPQHAIELWELKPDEHSDEAGKRIRSTLETASYQFGNPMQLKRLERGELWYDEIDGEVLFKIWFRADQNPCWTLWDSWSVCAKMEQCEEDFEGECPTIKNLREQYRTRKMLPRPAEDCESSDKKPVCDGYEFQVRLEVTGHCRLRKLRLSAREQEMDVNPQCN